MKKLTSTEISTAEIDVALKALPRPMVDFLHANDAELQRFRQANATAHQKRTERLLEAIRRCYTDHRLRIEYSPLSARTGVLYGMLQSMFIRYGLSRPPGDEKCRDVVYEFAGVKRKTRSG